MRTRLRKRLIVAGIVALSIWVAFFDSHSILRRFTYATELSRLTTENEALSAENLVLETSLERGLDAGTVEGIAREQYGMRRPGERVYRVETAED